MAFYEKLIFLLRDFLSHFFPEPIHETSSYMNSKAKKKIELRYACQTSCLMRLLVNKI